jgi:hypothetical protein
MSPARWAECGLDGHVDVLDDASGEGLMPHAGDGIMSISMYRSTIPVFVRGLGILSQYVDKAREYAEANGIEPAKLVEARLAPDMLPFAGQIQRASDTSKNAIGRLTGIEAPRFDDTETTLDELEQRIAKTVAFIASVGAKQLEGSEEREIALNFSKLKTTFRGDEYLLTFALPNFFFHIATAHGILRHQGVQVGKADYLGSFS